MIAILLPRKEHLLARRKNMFLLPLLEQLPFSDYMLQSNRIPVPYKTQTKQ
jgi:hypothetical protein